MKPFSNFVPAFGDQEPGAIYTPRSGAYAVILDPHKRVAAIDGPGGYYLPGGGIESGENDQDAIRREVMEECSASIELLGFLGQATDYVHAVAEGTYFEKQGRFFQARFVSPPAAGTVVWIPQEDVNHVFRQEGHVWAVAQLVETGS